MLEVVLDGPKKFELGEIVATPGALDALRRNGITPESLIRRHVSGDWGKLTANDEIMNEMALQHGGRLLSVYELADGTTIYLITEWDRSVTTILRDLEY